MYSTLTDYPMGRVRGCRVINDYAARPEVGCIEEIETIAKCRSEAVVKIVGKRKDLQQMETAVLAVGFCIGYDLLISGLL